MKRIALIITAITATSLLAACHKPEVVAQPPPTPPPATPAVVVATPTPAPIPAPVVAEVTPPPATPIPRALLPDGVFVVIRNASLETADGITGLKPGDMVEGTDVPGTYLFKGDIKIPLRPDQVTNDVLIARAAIAQDYAAQAGLQRFMAAAPTPVPTPNGLDPEKRALGPATTNVTDSKSVNYKRKGLTRYFYVH
jgi:hypothetical protein